MKTHSIVKESIVDLTKKHYLFLFGLIIIIAGVVLSSLAPAQMLRIIIDNHFVTQNAQGIVGSALLFFLLYALMHLLDFIKNFMLVIAGQNISCEIQAKMAKKLGRLTAGYFTGHDDGEISSYFINDVDTINYVFTNGIIGMFIDLFKIIGIIISIYLFSPIISLVTCCAVPIILIMTRIVQKAMLKAQMQNRQIVGKVNNCIAETKDTFNMIKISGKESFMNRRFNDFLDVNYVAAEKINLADSVSSPMTQMLRAAVIGIIVFLSAKNIGLSLGMLAASIELITDLFTPLENVGTELQSIQGAIAGIKRVNYFYNQEEDPQNSEKTAEDIFSMNSHISIEFDHVSFAYIKNRPVIEDISFQVANNQKLAIAGRTGVGKTTMFYLIMGLYRPDMGKIQINGINTHDITNRDKRKIFGYVNQLFSPIAGTIFEQVSVKDPAISRQMVEAAIKAVGLEEDVTSLANSYDTLYTDGILSKGQMQLLGIARAIVLQPKILLLDEMSANLDSLSEIRIQKALEQIGSNKSSISISHRISSMLVNDEILFLKDGRIEKRIKTKDLENEHEWIEKQIRLESYNIS